MKYAAVVVQYQFNFINGKNVTTKYCCEYQFDQDNFVLCI